MKDKQTNQTIYHYVDGDTQSKEKDRINKKTIYYNKENSELNRYSPQVIGITRFKKENKRKDCIKISNKSYRIDKIKKSDKIDGFLETSSGVYVAYRKESAFIFYLLIPLWLIILLLWFTSAHLMGNSANQDETPEKDWIVGGIEGTDVELSPKKETSYNTYWGYQEITIDKTMKVPFVNKDVNESYAQFSLCDKDGNLIWQSVLIKPGTRDEWDAYEYYNKEKGTYVHDLKVMFYNPVYDEDGNIVDFVPSMFGVETPDFKIHIR